MRQGLLKYRTTTPHYTLHPVEYCSLGGGTGKLEVSSSNSNNRISFNANGTTSSYIDIYPEAWIYSSSNTLKFGALDNHNLLTRAI